MDTDLLIVGAGPSGLMLANQVVRRGLRPFVIDRNAGPAQQSRALGVQARTLEIYSHLGLAGRAVELGKRATGANLWALGRHTARVPLGDIGQDLSPYPFLLILGQDDNEHLLGDALNGHGVAVRWNTELIGLAQSPDHVRATVRQPDGTTRELKARWLAGCDGARSAVREGSGIAFRGAPYDHVFFVADTRATGPMVPDELNVYLWRAGFHLFFPMRGENHWRVIGIVPPALRGRADLAFEDVLPSVRQEGGTGLAFQGCTWFSTYRIHHRRAERFRDRRCFLVGDAAHVHSPVGAQGMNTGLQDAYNLAWKLALVVAGRAGEALLDSYEPERIPVARRLLDTTDRAFSLIVSDSRIAGLLRTRLLARTVALAMTVERIRRFAFRTVSQTGIRYPDSPLSETLPGLPAGAPRAGDRFPWLHLEGVPGSPAQDVFGLLDDRRLNLLLFGQSLPGQAQPVTGDLLRVHAIPDTPATAGALAHLRIPRPSWYLLRPDGHVGIAGGRVAMDALARYLSARLHLRNP